MTYYRIGDLIRLVRWLDEYGEETDLPRGVYIGMKGRVYQELDEDGDIEVEFELEEDGLTWTECYYCRPHEIEPWEPVDPAAMVSAKIKRLWEQSNYYKKVNGIENSNPAIQNGESERETAGERLGRDLQYLASVSRPAVSSEGGSFDNQLGLQWDYTPGAIRWLEQYFSSWQLSEQAQNIQALNGALRQDAGVDYGQASGGTMDQPGEQSSLPPNGEWGAWGGDHLGPQYGGISGRSLVYQTGDELEGVSDSRIQREDDRLRAEETPDRSTGE